MECRPWRPVSATKPRLTLRSLKDFAHLFRFCLLYPRLDDVDVHPCAFLGLCPSRLIVLTYIRPKDRLASSNIGNIVLVLAGRRSRSSTHSINHEGLLDGECVESGMGNERRRA